MDRMNELWRDVGGPGQAPGVSVRAVKNRVNATLDADPGERKVYMKQKMRMALLLVAAAAAITGSALAASENWDMLSAFFRGDTSSAQEYVDNTPRTVSDENYTFTVESAVSDGEHIYMVASVTALSKEAKGFLPDKFFSSIDTWWVRTAEDDAYRRENPQEPHTPESVPSVSSLGSGNLPSAQENTRRFSLRADIRNGPTASLLIRLGYMEKSAVLEIPVLPAPSVTVEIGAIGLGIPEYDTLYSTPLTISSVTLSPFNCTIKCSDVYNNQQYICYPNLSFRMADGSVRTLNQMTRPNDGDGLGSGWKDEEDLSHHAWQFYYRFREVQELEDIVSLIIFDTEYPLNGSASSPVEHDPLLDPFTLPVTGALSDNVVASVPVRALTEALGGACDWDPATGLVTCTYRGISILFRPGEGEALVNGQPVTMSAPSQVQDGLTVACASLFDNAWGISSDVQRQILSSEDGEIEQSIGSWLIVP